MEWRSGCVKNSITSINISMANIVNMKSPKQNRCDVETNKIIILWGWSKL